MASKTSPWVKDELLVVFNRQIINEDSHVSLRKNNKMTVFFSWHNSGVLEYYI